MNQEIALHGGTTNRGLVFRVGDTVRRPRRTTSASTEALLQHLADVGFDGAPRFLGVDEQGREVLSYIPGETVTPPYSAWALTEEALRSVVLLLRRYHEAVAGFVPTGHTWPEPQPPTARDGLVSHNDPNLDNVVFRDGHAVALIDFDLAGPGSRLWDLAATARLWVPLRPAAEIADVRRDHCAARLRLAVQTYGGPATDPDQLLDAVVAHHAWSYDIMRVAADGGHRAFADYLDNATLARADRTHQWYEQTRWLREVLP